MKQLKRLIVLCALCLMASSATWAQEGDKSLKQIMNGMKEMKILTYNLATHQGNDGLKSLHEMGVDAFDLFILKDNKNKHVAKDLFAGNAATRFRDAELMMMVQKDQAKVNIFTDKGDKNILNNLYIMVHSEKDEMVVIRLSGKMKRDRLEKELHKTDNSILQNIQ